MEFVHHGGFANAGIAGDKNQLRPATRNDTVKGRQQHASLARPPIKFFRDQELVRCVVLSKWKFANAAMSLPFGKATPEIACQARGGLIALFYGLGEELHDDGGDRCRDRLNPLSRRHWFP